MSLILEALRKSEAERRRGQSPELFAAMPMSGGVHRPARPQQAWLWLLTLLLVAASITGWYRYTHKAPPATIEKHSGIAKAPAKSPSPAPAMKDAPADLTGMDHTAMQYVPESRPAQTEGAPAMVANAAGSTPNAVASLFPRQLETTMPNPVASSGSSSTTSAPSATSPGSPPPAPMTSAPAPAATSAAPPASIPGVTSAPTPAMAHTPTTAPTSTPAAAQAPTTPASAYATTATPTPATTPTPAKASATAPAPTRMPGPVVATAMMPAPPNPATMPAPAQTLSTPRPIPPSPPKPSETVPKAATPAVARASDATPASPNADRDLLSLAMLGPKERSELPPYKLSMHVWASEPGKRFAIIDGHRVTEGSMATGSVVEEIRRDGVVLNLRGRRYLLPRP